MKRYLEPILLVTVEVLLILFSGVDMSLIFFVGAITFGYFFLRRILNQNEAVVYTRQHRILAANFRINPFDTHTLQEGLELEKKIKNYPRYHINVKWVYLVLCLANIAVVGLIIADVIIY